MEHGRIGDRPAERDVGRVVAIDVAVDGDAAVDHKLALGERERDHAVGARAAAGQRVVEGDGVGGGRVLVGERERLAQRQVVGAAEIGERGVGIVGIELVVERGDLEALGELQLEGAEVEFVGGAAEIDVRSKPRASVSMVSVWSPSPLRSAPASPRVGPVGSPESSAGLSEVGLSAMVWTAPPLSASRRPGTHRRSLEYVGIDRDTSRKMSSSV